MLQHTLEELGCGVATSRCQHHFRVVNTDPEERVAALARLRAHSLLTKIRSRDPRLLVSDKGAPVWLVALGHVVVLQPQHEVLPATPRAATPTPCEYGQSPFKSQASSFDRGSLVSCMLNESFNGLLASLTSSFCRPRNPSPSGTPPLSLSFNRQVWHVACKAGMCNPRGGAAVAEYQLPFRSPKLAYLHALLILLVLWVCNACHFVVLPDTAWVCVVRCGAVRCPVDCCGVAGWGVQSCGVGWFAAPWLKILCWLIHVPCHVSDASQRQEEEFLALLAVLFHSCHAAEEAIQCSFFFLFSLFAQF